MATVTQKRPATIPSPTATTSSCFMSKRKAPMAAPAAIRVLHFHGMLSRLGGWPVRLRVSVPPAGERPSHHSGKLVEGAEIVRLLDEREIGGVGRPSRWYQ